MKRNYFICAVATILLFSLGSCKHQDRMLLRFSQTDTNMQLEDATLFDFVWKDGVLQQVRKNNPFAHSDSLYEDYAAIFNYTLDYAYKDGGLSSLSGNKFHSEFVYENGRLVRIDQFSKDGILAYRVTFDQGDSNKVKAVYYAMTEESIKWLESNLYPRNDSTGARVCMEMPEDTTLHVKAEANYQWNNDNLVYAKVSFAEGLVVESHMEYDSKINPFYRTYCEFDRLDVLAISLPFGFNNSGVSKNNVTKAVVSSQLAGEETSETIFENTYEYDGDYPIVQRSNQNASEYHYEYEK